MIALGRIVAFSLAALETILNYYDQQNQNSSDNIVGWIETLLLSLRYLPDLFYVFALGLFGWFVLTLFLIGLIQLNDYKNITLSNRFDEI